jgi:hypothetical protein
MNTQNLTLMALVFAAFIVRVSAQAPPRPAPNPNNAGIRIDPDELRRTPLTFTKEIDKEPVASPNTAEALIRALKLEVRRTHYAETFLQYLALGRTKAQAVGDDQRPLAEQEAGLRTYLATMEVGEEVLTPKDKDALKRKHYEETFQQLLGVQKAKMLAPADGQRKLAEQEKALETYLKIFEADELKSIPAKQTGVAATPAAVELPSGPLLKSNRPATTSIPGALATRPGSYDLPQDVRLVIAESAPAKADKGPIIDGQLIWGPSYASKREQYYNIKLSEGQPYAVAWSADGKTLWVTCAAGSAKETPSIRYLRILSIRGPGDVEEEMKDFNQLDAITIGKMPQAMRDIMNGRPIPETAPAPGASTSYSDATLQSLSWHQFDQTRGQHWRALADRGHYAEAAILIDRYLALHPELDLDNEAINGANIHFHAAQCRAFTVHTSGALKHLALAHHQQPTPGGLLWNDYVDGTAAFLLRDMPKLRAARDKLAAGSEVNKANLLVLDRLIANFGKSRGLRHGSSCPMRCQHIPLNPKHDKNSHRHTRSSIGRHLRLWCGRQSSRRIASQCRGPVRRGTHGRGSCAVC